MNIIRKTIPVGPAHSCDFMVQVRPSGTATVITGHWPETTIGQEMRFNAFVRA